MIPEIVLLFVFLSWVANTAVFLSLNAVVLVNLPRSEYFQLYLHDVVLVPTCIVIFQRCLTLKVFKVRHPYPLLAPVVLFSLAHICGLCLCLFSALVCDLLPRRLFHGSPKAHCQKSISVTFLTSTAWRTLGLLSAFPTLVGGQQ